jgi:small GTP-binding protein
MKKLSEDLNYNDHNDKDIYVKKYSSNDITYIYKYIPTFKIIFIGDSGSGKSSIIEKYINNIILKEHEITICINYKTKIIDLDKIINNNNTKLDDKIILFDYNNNNIRLHIWDTSGCIKYKNIIQNYFKDINMFIFVFDITDNKYSDIISEYLNIIYEMYDNPEFFIIINKKDLNDKYLNINQIIKNYNFINYNFIEISCFNDDNINDLFNQIILLLIKKDINNNNNNNNIKNVNIKKTRNCICGFNKSKCI